MGREDVRRLAQDQAQGPFQAPACWLELSSDRLLHNLAGVRSLVGPARIMAVVKANGYGAGAAGMAHVLSSAGVDAFGVGSVPEGVSLRMSGIRGEIHCLAYFTDREVDAILEYGLIPAIYRLEDARVLSDRAAASGRIARTWIKVDTGLGRLGAPWRAAPELMLRVSALPRLRVGGLLSTLTENPERDREQVRRLLAVQAQAPAAAGLQLSLASSNAVLSLPESYLDVVRPGIMLLGWEPSERSRLDARLLRHADLQPVAAWKARVLNVNNVERGEQVGYGLRPALERDTVVAVLAAGWATGYPSAMSRGGHVLLHGRRCPILAVSAHTTMVDVGNAPGAAAVNDEAVLLGRQDDEEITAEEILAATGESVYHLLAGIPAEVERKWL